MSHDYNLSEYNPFLNMPDLQPPPLQPLYPTYPVQQNMHPMNDPRAPPPYEMTAAASAGAACAEGVPPPAASVHPLDPRKRKNSHFDYEMSDAQFSGSDGSVAGTAGSGSAMRRKRKSSFGSSNVFEDECCDESRSSRTTSTLPDKKQNHSEIEKRRRDKMNKYITELSAMIPMCGAMARKLDKLTVLRMAVAHLRLVRGAQAAGPLAAQPRPAFLEERDLNALLLDAAADCFLIVVGCARGRLLYVSRSVANMLHYTQAELVGHSMFDILHPKDVAKVKEQLSSSDLSPRERFIDAKTMLPVKGDVVAGVQRLCPGARRSFFCRIKCKASADPAPPPAPPTAPPEPATQRDAPVKEDPDNNTKHRKKNDKKYCVVQCTGYLKSWAPAEMEGCGGGGGAETDGDDQCTLSCLVAVGRALPDLAPPCAPASAPTPHPPPAPATRPLQYVSRHAIDGKFLFVDQRVTLALGFLPQELLGTSLYEYVCARSVGGVARAHKTALVHRAPARTPPYAFRRKDGTSATIHTHFKPFRNPWTKDVECLVANNTIVSETEAADDAHDYGLFKQTDEWRDFAACVASCAPAPPPPPPPPPAPPPQLLGVGGVGGVGGGGGVVGGGGDAEVQRLIDSQVESHKIGSAIAEEVCRRPPSGFSPPALLLQDPLFNPSSLVDNILGVELSSLSGRGEGGGEGGASPPLPPLGIDGNGEAAMAVIMSLLEADAGLGGPVNFSGLPWPLP